MNLHMSVSWVSLAPKQVDCRVVEWIKYSTHEMVLKREKNIKKDFVKRMYETKIEGNCIRRRPPVKYINRVNDNWQKKVCRWSTECAKRGWGNIENWRKLHYAQSLGRVLVWGKDLQDIWLYINKEITHQKIEEREVGCCCAGHFSLLLLEHLQGLNRILEILLPQVHDSLVDLQVIG